MLISKNLIHHVDKADNTANLPEARPIEDFWAQVKVKLYENNWEVIIRKCLKELDT